MAAAVRVSAAAAIEQPVFELGRPAPVQHLDSGKPQRIEGDLDRKTVHSVQEHSQGEAS
jgi:hypothetical protein